MSKNELNLSADNKKLYIFEDQAYFKVVGMNDIYYLKVEDYDIISLKQTAITLYKLTRKGLVSIQSYIKSIDISDILFISAPTVAHRFKMFDLEKVS